MIKQITIEHYKSLDNVSLSLKPISVFVGPNASGKSNLIDALRFVRDAVRYDLDRAVSERHGIDSIRQWSPSRPYHVKISIILNLKSDASETGEMTGSFSLTLGSAKGNYQIVKEEAKTSFIDKNHED